VRHAGFAQQAEERPEDAAGRTYFGTLAVEGLGRAEVGAEQLVGAVDEV
jgi:hypothetical protein